MKSKTLLRFLALLSVGLLTAQTKISAPTQIKQLSTTGIYWYASNLSFGSISPAACKEANFAATAATPGYLVIPGWPSLLPAPIYGIMYSADNVIVVRLCNSSQSTLAIPDGLTYSAGVLK